MRLGTLVRWYALKNILKENINDDMIIIDLGGYDGYIPSKLNIFINNLKIFVIDMNKEGLLIADKCDHSAIKASVLQLPFKNSQADIVLCLDLIEHVNEDDKLIIEIFRVLKSSGKVILTTPMEYGVPFPFVSKKNSEIINKGWGHVRNGYNIKKLSEMLNNNGIIIDNTDKYFNLFSRFTYWICNYSRIPFFGKVILYKTVMRMEPYVKYGAKEHIIIGKKES